MVIRAHLLARSRWRNARWLVLAPHPDDETIGAGALIAETAREGRLAAIAYLTDGTGSHPAGTFGIAGIRRREARHAVHRLSVPRQRILSIGWQDARPHAAGSASFERSRDVLAAFVRREKVDAIAVTARDEAHCDHVAAFGLAQAVVRRAHRAIGLFEYRVWSMAGGRPAFSSGPLLAGLRRHALAAHRSQLTPSMGPGFRLDDAQRLMPACDILELRGRDR